MTEFRIGGEWAVPRLGYGAMHLTAPSGPDRAESITVVRRAVELGVRLIDTAYMYGGGANEELLAAALHPYPRDLLIATKVGISLPRPGEWVVDGRPEVLRDQVDGALRRLRVERIGLLQLHRRDPAVPLSDQLGALRDAQAAGKVAHLGLSEIALGELHEARRIIDVASVQNRYNVLDREHEPVVRACTEAGIAFLPWRPVAHGATGGTAEVAAVATELGATATQVSLAWLLHRSPAVLPIPSTTSLAHLAQNVAAARIPLTAEQVARLDRIVVPGST
ncbi:aldo/keto reductase [Pseudonocardia sp.]|uniref:aldo/keto reductase n=1 Tax=Pseudonocardia sp. TaxID=60912 RepID=UPI00262C3A16|nr:aldo/keto reductase [Pseudonocardia sp.]